MGARDGARESGIHFIAAGHHATETFGPRALGEHLRERFGGSPTDIPVANPVYRIEPLGGLRQGRGKTRLVSVLAKVYK